MSRNGGQARRQDSSTAAAGDTDDNTALQELLRVMSAEERDAAAAADASKRGMASLEMEGPSNGRHDGDEEMESLVSDSTGRLKKRSAGAGGDGSGSNDEGGGGFFAALLPRNQNFSARNLFLVAGMAGLVFYFAKDVNDAVLSYFSSNADAASEDPRGQNVGTNFHGPSFGGVNNVGHPGGARAYAKGEFGQFEEIFVPVSNVGHAVPSLAPENILNFMGHYEHDEHRSPYASHLYNRSIEELDAEQKKYEEKMKAVREKWGAWDLKDDYSEKNGGDDRPAADFGNVKYRDLSPEDFPEGSWQTDPEYLDKFLSEAKALVERVKEGIYAEYGQPTIKDDGTKLTDEEIKERNDRFAVAHGKDEDKAGKIGQLEPEAWEGLVTKLLHAMMTHDEFYVVLGGHSAAAGHGNNFRETKVMAFHKLMEPIFDKLGMRLVSRNMAQGGLGTTPSAMASGMIYGEKDLMLWDSGMTERAAGAHDVYNKQGILGGERVPVILNCPRVNIMKDTDGLAWVGTTLESLPQPGGMVPFTTTDDKQAETLPFAVRYMFCDKAVNELCQKHKYDSICWQPRTDIEPKVAQGKGGVQGQASWHPGVRSHLFAGRVYSLVVLHALDDAIDRWRAATESGDVPLPADMWHVGEKYRKVQDVLRTKIANAEEGGSECEKLFHQYPRACRVAMRGYGEWTPRRIPTESSFVNLIHPAPNGYVPHLPEPMEYAGIDVLPLNQRVPEGQVDVHAIAIASTAPAPHLDHKMEGGEEERRRLIAMTSEAVRVRTRRARESHDRKRRRQRALEGKKSPPSSSEPSARHARRLDGEEEIVPGRGWQWDGQMMNFCDGSYASECGRAPKSNCLLSGHNDGRGGFKGDSYSGWFVFTVPKVKEGLILLRMEWWNHVAITWTKGWTEVDDGKTKETEPPYAFPDLTPGVNATTPFDRLKEAKAEKADAASKEEEKAEAPATEGGANNSTANATRSLLRRARALRRMTAAGRSTASVGNRTEERQQQGQDISSFDYPFEDLNGDDWRSPSEEDFYRRGRRRRAKNIPPLPDDWQFDVAVNGKIVRTLNKDEYMSRSVEIVKNFALWTIMDDVEWAKREWGDGDEGEDVECAVRIRSKENPRRTIKISHVYYA